MAALSPQRSRGEDAAEVRPGRCDYHGDEDVSLPVDIRDRSDRSTGKDWKELLR